MNADDLPIALFGFLAFVVMSPLWIRYLDGFQASQPTDAILAAMVLPAAAGLYLASWISTELARLLLGGFILVSIMLLAPWFFRFSDMLSTQLGTSPLTEFILALAIPVLILMYVFSLGKRRLIN